MEVTTSHKRAVRFHNSRVVKYHANCHPPYNSLLRHYSRTIGRAIHYGKFLVCECLIWHRIIYHPGIYARLVHERYEIPLSLRETSQILRGRRSEQRKAVSVHIGIATSRSRVHRTLYEEVHMYVYIRKLHFTLTAYGPHRIPIYRSLLGRNARRDAEGALEKEEEENPLCPSSRNDSRLCVCVCVCVPVAFIVRQFPLHCAINKCRVHYKPHEGYSVIG